MSVSLLRAMAAFGVLCIAGCPQPDPAPLAETIPGFSPCRATHSEDAEYSICADDAGFPYGEWVAGKIIGSPASFGPAASMSFQTDDGPVWSLSSVGHFGFSLQRPGWSADDEDDAPHVELHISAPCDDSGHWFAVRSFDAGQLIVGGGRAATATIDDWSVDGTLPGDKCEEPVNECPCSEECTVSPTRYGTPSLVLDLYPSERGIIEQGYEVLALENWTAVGASTCEDGRTEGRRWLILGLGE